MSDRPRTMRLIANIESGLAGSLAGHESTRTTQLYNRLQEEISLDEIERIHI